LATYDLFLKSTPDGWRSLYRQCFRLPPVVRPLVVYRTGLT